MKRYYCHNGAKPKGLIEEPPTGRKVKSKYQYGKHRKHTKVDSSHLIQSVFSDPSTSVYATYIVSTMLEGAVEIDERGRKDLIWCAGKHTGFRHEAGKMIKPTDAVKFVLASDSTSLHDFTENSTSFNAGKCSECGNVIVF